MKMQRLAIALTAINLVLLLLTVAQAGRTTAQTVTPILRGRALELVDDRGQVRSRLNVEPTGEVVLRLLDKTGSIRVKLGAGEDGSGLVLADEATEPAIHIIARRTGTSERPTTTSITLRGTDGQQRVISRSGPKIRGNAPPNPYEAPACQEANVSCERHLVHFCMLATPAFGVVS